MVKTPRVWDIPRILHSFVLTHNGLTGVVPYSGYLSPGLIAAASALPMVTSRHRPFLSRRRRAVGLALTKPRRETDQLDLAWMLIRADDDAQSNGRQPAQTLAGGVVADLLEAVCKEAAEEGIVSVFARIAEECDFRGVFGEYGFNVVAREHTYVREVASVPDPVEIEGLREQEKPDAWGVQQLYRACTPATVQLAENLTSRTWDRPKRRGFNMLRGAGQCDSFVVDGQHGIDAWLRVVRSEDGPHHLKLMVHPALAKQVPGLVNFTLEWLSNYSSQPVLATVRDYEMGMIRALETSGFQPRFASLLLVRHLGIRFRQPVSDRALGRVHN